MTIAQDNAALAATRPAQRIAEVENVTIHAATEEVAALRATCGRWEFPTAAAAAIGRAYDALAAMGPLPAVTVTIRRDGAAVVVGIEEAS